ncbi:MAG: DUF5662 family protein [Patescibacteria group bacterium]|jgi:hypothetical protein
MIFNVIEPKYTKEMEDWFVKRTTNHIKNVQRYCNKIESYDPKRFKGLVFQAKWHDSLKFREPERTPYIFTTWTYKCKAEGVPYEPPEEMKEPMNNATAHHIKNSKHHPEYWSDVTTNLVNPDARDEASQTIDATKMDTLSVAEMVADWFAVSKERHNPVEFWANKNVNKRWMFTPEQTAMIYELVENIKP